MTVDATSFNRVDKAVTASGVVAFRPERVIGGETRSPPRTNALELAHMGITCPADRRVPSSGSEAAADRWQHCGPEASRQASAIPRDTIAASFRRRRGRCGVRRLTRRDRLHATRCRGWSGSAAADRRMQPERAGNSATGSNRAADRCASWPSVTSRAIPFPCRLCRQPPDLCGQPRKGVRPRLKAR